MVPDDIFAMHSAKVVEYLIAVAFLLLFIPFWRFVSARPAARMAMAVERRVWPEQIADWFRLPERLYFHPGHAWARLDEGGVVTVGLDDFAQRLVGPLAAIELPAVGARVGQGEPAWRLKSDSKAIDMLSPVDGTVVAANEHVMSSPEALKRDPYGEGWLLKVHAPRAIANTKHLLTDRLARRWMEEVCDELGMQMSPDLGRLYHDGGLPIDGIARDLSPDRWDEIARRFFLTLDVRKPEEHARDS